MLVTQSCPTLCGLTDCSCQAPLSLGFPRQEYWNGLLFPSPIGIGMKMVNKLPVTPLMFIVDST